jgi:hypothetical protein
MLRFTQYMNRKPIEMTHTSGLPRSKLTAMGHYPELLAFTTIQQLAAQEFADWSRPVGAPFISSFAEEISGNSFPLPH